MAQHTVFIHRHMKNLRMLYSKKSVNLDQCRKCVKMQKIRETRSMQKCAKKQKIRESRPCRKCAKKQKIVPTNAENALKSKKPASPDQCRKCAKKLSVGEKFTFTWWCNRNRGLSMVRSSPRNHLRRLLKAFKDTF